MSSSMTIELGDVHDVIYRDESGDFVEGVVCCKIQSIISKLFDLGQNFFHSLTNVRLLSLWLHSLLYCVISI